MMLEVDRVSKYFISDGSRLDVIKEVSFSLKEGGIRVRSRA
jgi:ABC-type oligopeptide transport system ATPase subunit